jgi:FKBP-type peptidyl-prolyl cis-trans isomerase
MSPSSSSKSKSKKDPSSSSSSLEKYQGMTLDELSKLEDGGANDEEIDEDEAFNSEDEQKYGQYFQSMTTKRVVPRRNIALSIPIVTLIPSKDPNREKRGLEIPKGSSLLVSSVCLDVMEGTAFDRARLMYRCRYDDDGDDIKDAPFLALCNFLSTGRGGMGLMPSTPVNLKVIGPCTVDFSAGALPCRGNPQDKINVFGVIEPSVKDLYGHDNDEEDDDDYFPYADAFMSGASEDEDDDDEGDAEDDEDEKNELEVKKPTNSEGSSSAGATSSKKRKQDENVNNTVMESTATITATTDSHSSAGDNSKLTKAQRKKLAQEKAKQLEETLAAARNNDDVDSNNNEPQSKKSKEQAQKEKDASEKTATSSTTQTRERRLAGGLIVSDVVLGVGAPVKPGKRISIHYTGTLRSSGKVFDKNHSKQHPLVFRQGTGEVIRGKRVKLDMTHMN